MLGVSSSDGFVTFLTFDEGEIGEPLTREETSDLHSKIATHRARLKDSLLAKPSKKAKKRKEVEGSTEDVGTNTTTATTSTTTVPVAAAAEEIALAKVPTNVTAVATVGTLFSHSFHTVVTQLLHCSFVVVP
jgi:hypothetical protein